MKANDLLILQSYPLDMKIGITKRRILDAIKEYTINGLYLSISGGKDSIALHTICRDLEYELFGEMRIPRVFCNTGLEYPELVSNLRLMFESKSQAKVFTEIRPAMSFRDVVIKYGYPVVSKEQSQFLHQYRVAKSEPIGFWLE